MSDSEPFAPRQFNPDEVVVPPAARESFSDLRHLGGGVLWLCAAFSLGEAAITWQNSQPATWLSATAEVAGAVWMPVLGCVLLLQNIGESLPRRRHRWLSLMSWALLAWGLLLIGLMAASGLATSRLYQKQTEEHSAAEVVRSESFQRLRAALQNTSDVSEMKQLTIAARVPLPPSDALPEAPRPRREHLVNLAGAHEEALDRAAAERLRSDHADTLLRGLAHILASLLAAAVSLLAWARSGWIRLLGD